MDKKTNQKEMISCIICSRLAEIQQELKENINATIGCDYELVVIDNSANKYSIFSAYNEVAVELRETKFHSGSGSR